MVFTFLENTLNLCTFTDGPVSYSKLPVEIFENLFPPRRKGWRKLSMIYFIRIQSRNMKMTMKMRIYI